MNYEDIKILIVDDESDIVEFLKYNFEKEGFSVFTAANGVEGIKKAQKHQPDLIIMDVMMPEMDGIEACNTLREMPEFSSTLILLLTARNEDYSEIAGFDAGADDYVTKPVRPRVLIKRVKSLLKRSKNGLAKMEEIVELKTFGKLTINTEKRIVISDNEEVKLPKKEFEILLLLSTKPEKVFSREEIYSKIWGNDVFVGDRTLDVHIRKLRLNIGEDYIKTSKGTGYSFCY